jgi:hypothetical protein
MIESARIGRMLGCDTKSRSDRLIDSDNRRPFRQAEVNCCPLGAAIGARSACPIVNVLWRGSVSRRCDRVEAGP